MAAASLCPNVKPTVAFGATSFQLLLARPLQFSSCMSAQGIQRSGWIGNGASSGGMLRVHT